MKFKIIISFSLLISCHGFSQDPTGIKQNRKGKLYFYWGWNRCWFTQSNINFKGTDYDFTLNQVVAKDRQTKFDVKTYFYPTSATIPQYNFRLGYFFKNHFNLSIGADHMKYVVQQDQVVNISGHINNSNTVYNGTYSNDTISIRDNFLKFEHTDGLNYMNIELRRFDEIIDLKKIKISLTEGIGTGILLPRTNTTLLNNKRYDEFHLAGYGVGAVAGINIEFYKIFFIQTEFKGGFINMPDIRTTMSKSDKASQHFFFSQFNVVFGAILRVKKNKTNVN